MQLKHWHWVHNPSIILVVSLSLCVMVHNAKNDDDCVNDPKARFRCLSKLSVHFTKSRSRRKEYCQFKGHCTHPTHALESLLRYLDLTPTPTSVPIMRRCKLDRNTIHSLQSIWHNVQVTNIPLSGGKLNRFFHSGAIQQPATKSGACARPSILAFCITMQLHDTNRFLVRSIVHL